MSAPTLQVADARRIMQALPPEELAALLGELGRDAMKDRTYELLPLGEHVAAYLRVKKKSGADNTILAYESTLARFARTFPHLDLGDFETPVGIERLEEWLDQEWGSSQPATYNRHLAALVGFLEFHRRRGKIHSNAAKEIERARKRDPYREIFSKDQRRGIVASQEELRDRIALRLLLHYGLRKGGLRAVQFKHFDHVRKKLAVFLKGGEVRNLPIPDPAFWHDLERHILDAEAKPGHYLMTAGWGNRHASRRDPQKPMSGHALHKWWYRCLQNAGVTEEGQTSGERMHKARHTAGQAVLDATGGNLKATQKLLMHKSIRTTGDIYTDWDDEAMTLTLADVIRQESQ